MISSSIIQREYNRFYKEVRKYIWGFQAVEALADLEISVYQRIPDMFEIQDNLNKFRQYSKEVELDDEEFVKAADRLQDLLDENEEPYAKLYEVREVL